MIRNNGENSFQSDVEIVNVYLQGGDDSFRVDSVYDYGQTNIFGGDGDDALTVGATGTGIVPTDSGQVDHVYGDLLLDGESGTNTIIFNDSEEDEHWDDNPNNVGRYEGATVYGLGMPLGSVTFANGDIVEILMGAGRDRFYVPSVDLGVVATLKTGGNKDEVFVGTVSGMEQTGSLDGILGDIYIEGQGPEIGDRLNFNDQSATNPQNYTIRNSITGDRQLSGGAPWPIDTTEVTINGLGSVFYRSMETVVLNAGSGNDIINVESTHREQDVAGGKASSFVVNSGAGADTINLGEPVAGGYSLDSFSIDLETPTYDSIKGIPVILNGQNGEDAVHFFDSATTVDSNLAFTQYTFAELFPATEPGDADGASDTYVELYTDIFGEDPQSEPYATVVLSRQAEVTVESLDPPTDSTYRVTHDATDGSFNMTISGLSGGDLEVTDIPYDVSSAGLKGLIDIAALDSGQTLVVEVQDAPSGNGWDLIFSDPSSGVGIEVNGSGLTRGSPLNVSARTAEEIRATLGSGNDLIQLTSDVYEHNIRVYGNDGNDVFNVEYAVDLLGNRAIFNGQGGDDTVFFNFEQGVPTTNLDIEFNGGSQSAGGLGDKIRLAGDGAERTR